MRYFPDNSAFYYMGRIDTSDKREPLFTYAGSLTKVCFTGTSVGVYIRNIPMGVFSSLGIVIDGIQQKIVLEQDDSEHFYNLAQELTDEKHTLVIFKRQAAAHYFRFCGIEVDDGSELSRSEKPDKFKFEVYGDSVSAGEVVEAVYYDAHCDPENHNGIYDNSWFSYPLALARRMNAEVYDNSQGGLALFDKTGYFCGPTDFVGLETTYNKLSYVPYSPMGYTEWDFSRYTPDLVIFAIGQNDANPDNDAIKNPEYSRKWKDRYISLINELRGKYGEKTKFLLFLTVLMHYSIWDETVKELAEELNDEKIQYFSFKRCGQATPGHPRITEQEEMVGELNAFLTNWLDI